MHQFENRTDKFHFRQDIIATYLPHIHREAEILYVVNGVCEVLYNFQTYTLEKGDFFIAFPNTIHGYNGEYGGEVLLWIFDSMIFNDYISLFKQKNPVCPLIRKPQLGEDMLYVINAYENRKHLVQDSPTSRALLNLLISEAMQILELTNICEKEHYDWLTKVMIYINENFTQPLTLDSIAHIVGISKYHLSRTFKEKLGCSIPTYINRIKVDKAIELLRLTNLPITEIAFECGFESIPTFFRVFKLLMGESPKSYKNRLIENL